MAQRDQLGRALGRHDPRQLGRLDDRPLGRRSGANLVQRLGLAGNMSMGGCGSRGDLFPGHIDHSRAAAVIDVGETAHAQRSLSRGTCPASEQGR